VVTVSPPDTWAYALQLPHDPALRASPAPHASRASLVRMDDHADTAELLGCELVTNAYRHSDGPHPCACTAWAG